MDTNEPSPTFDSLQRHNKYYIPSADLSILVENIQFRVHRYFFDRESLYFKSRLITPASPIAPAPGSSDSTAFILEDVTASEFARFLWVFYNPRYSLFDEATLDDWQSILQLSHRWLFPEVKGLAVRELQKKLMLPVKRIKLYHDNNVDRNLLIPEYSALCEREESLTLEEGLDLGMETTLMIARGREEVRFTRLPSGVRSPLTPTFYGADLHEVIKELFKITPWSPEDAVILSPAGGEPNALLNGNRNVPPASKNFANTQISGGSSTKTPATPTQPQTPTVQQQKAAAKTKKGKDQKQTQENPTAPPTPATNSEKSPKKKAEGGQGTKTVAGQREKKTKKTGGENGASTGANGDDAGASQNKGASDGDTTKLKDGDVSVKATTTNDGPNSTSTKDNQTPTVTTTIGTGADNLNGGEDPKLENPIKNAGTDTGSATAGVKPEESDTNLLDLGDPPSRPKELGGLDVQNLHSERPKTPKLSIPISEYSSSPLGGLTNSNSHSLPYAVGNTNVIS